MRAKLATALTFLLLTAALPARAEPQAQGEPQAQEEPQAQPQARKEPQAQPQAAAVERPHRLIWRYPKFRWWEYAAAGAVSLGNISFEVLYQAEPRERWTGPILLDSGARDWLRADSKAARLRVDDV